MSGTEVRNGVVCERLVAILTDDQLEAGLDRPGGRESDRKLAKSGRQEAVSGRHQELYASE